MSVHDFQGNQKPTGVTGFTGAAPQLVTGNIISIASPNGTGSPVEVGSLSARAYAKATTNTLTITGKWRVSDDGTNFYDACVPQNAAEVALVTGTGSAVTDTVAVDAPSAVYGYKYARFVLTSGVGVGGGAGTDEGSVSYNYRIDRRI